MSYAHYKEPHEEFTFSIKSYCVYLLYFLMFLSAVSFLFIRVKMVWIMKCRTVESIRQNWVENSTLPLIKTNELETIVKVC